MIDWGRKVVTDRHNQGDIPPFWVVIPAAGVGQRMQADRPKQYLQLGKLSILERTLACFLKVPELLGVVVSLAADDPYWPTLQCSQDPQILRALGGEARADSVLAGLHQLLQSQGANPQDWVLVHDAARPNLANSDLRRLLETLADDPVGGLLACRARDTLKQVTADGRVVKTLDRTHIWHAFTPQMFRLGPLIQALEGALAAGIEVTDEASAMEWAGAAPRVVEGRADNLKVTTPEDLERLGHHIEAGGC